MIDDEAVFKALGDSTRRTLLDMLHARDGQSVTELEQRFEMSRFGIMKHLNILAQANLIVVRKEGRRSLHYLNQVPIRQIYNRWMHKFAEPWIDGMVDLKRTIEEAGMAKELKHVYEIYIRTTPELLWGAITSGVMTKKYFHQTRIESSWKSGDPIIYYSADDSVAIEGVVETSEPCTRLSYTWNVKYDPERLQEQPSYVGWEIEKMGDACKLTLIHSFDEESKTYREVALGWFPILSSLKSLLETGMALDVAD